jgi:CRP-like cAMP-binding protein
MSVFSESGIPDNQLLAALSIEDYQRLAPHLELVTLRPQQVLYEVGEPILNVYFPNRSIISLINTMEDGATIEVGLVGREGMVGIPVILDDDVSIHRAFVKIPDTALRVRADILKAEFNQGGTLQRLLLRYTQLLLVQLSQAAACNRFHTIEERLARQLLLIQDSLQTSEFPLTQEFLAQILGTRRSGVTVAAGAFNQAGMIRYSRGRITILNREGLEATSCECYQVIRKEFKRLFD